LEGRSEKRRDLPALVACAALLLWSSMPALAQEISWRQAVDRLSQEKIMAEGCASILKAFADDAPMARVQAQRLYARAQADMDGLIALFMVNLASERSPAETPDVMERLGTVLAQRRALCRHVDAAVGPALRQQPGRTRLADLLAEGSGGGASSMIDAAVQIWQAHRHADQRSREAIVFQIETTRWLAYAEVPAA
jgi:hypothetical protein